MAITEEARFQLFEKLRKALGAEEATTLMEHLPPLGWADVATRRDLDHLEVAMRRDLEHLEVVTRGDLEHLEGAMRGDLEHLEGVMDRRFDELERRFATKDDLHALSNRMVGWMLAGQATLVAAVAVLVGLR